MRRIQWRVLALALSLPLAACGDSSGAGSPGTLSLNLTDAPGDFAEAWVQIDRIELVGQSDKSEGGEIILLDEPVVTDLLSLSNDVALLVDEAVVPAGRYSQLRMIIPEACIVVEGEDEMMQVYASSTEFAESDETECGPPDGDLQMPSYDTSGLKIDLPGGSVEVDGDSRILLLDFDVQESFGRMAGGSGRWVMDPTVRAEDVSFAGSITVELTEGEASGLEAAGGALSDFEASLDSEPMPVAFEDPDEDGVWTATFLFLMPDTYEVSVGTVEGVTYEFTLAPSSPQSVDLPSGGSDTVSFQVTSAAGPTS